jgi:disease resistance protein RPM1
MNSVLDKLTKLNNHSNPADKFSMLTANLKEDLLGLKENFCDKLTGQQAKHKQVDVCMKQVRELVFKIEDWIDQNPESNLVVDPTQTFDYFKAKIHGARERFTRYFDLHKLVPTETDAAPIKITINPRLPVEEKYCFGIFDGPSNELVKYLTDEKEEMRKVVSVVGREGLGKTTLAKEIYSELLLRRQFECQAFVYVGRRTSMTMILKDILRQLNPFSKKWQHWRVVDVQEIITELWEYLSTKRYLFALTA